MNTGLSFVLAVVGVLCLGVVLAILVHEGNKIDERQRQHERAYKALGSLLPESQPPPCLRELDPNGPFDWQQMGDQ